VVIRGKQPATPAARIIEIFHVFLKLGLTSFGGPIAHIGYFRNELVLRRKWLDADDFGDLLALCQFLPGPASSQLGFSLGVLRGGGLRGGFAAWFAFTMPSALLLLACALGASSFTGPAARGAVHGLKLVAVAVVAQAVWGMARNFAPDRTRAAIALAAVVILAVCGVAAGQIAAIAAGAIAGVKFCKISAPAPAASGSLSFPVSRLAGLAALLLFALLFFVPAMFAGPEHQALALFAAFYRAGALVFGGGHVVLPLLQAAVVQPGWIASSDFTAGYGLAQAVPGPLFTFAAYLGAIMRPPPSGIAGASIALIAIFLPGLLLVYGMLPFWDRFRLAQTAQAAMRGANAAVVGILATALYSPVWIGAVFSPIDFALALTGFLLLTVWKFPPWAIVALLAASGAFLGRLDLLS
jgi:chromate transporter